MKRLLLAGLLVLPFALARSGVRADEHDAYGSLIGMAASASSDKGPQAGGIPPDLGGRMGGRFASVSAASKTDSAAPASPDVPASGAKTAAPAVKRETVKSGDAPAVFVPPAAAPRIWTKVFASLVPPMRRAPAFEVAASTSSRLDTAASDAGSAQGFRELFAAATAPSVPALEP
ncbi:MAG: hypothetical protein Q8T11_15020 [Elusimicrobiota bacterium]|nr:hypothetical protein [Elusimicrobiota bacterium]